MVSDKVFTTDGTQKIFSSDFDVISEDHIRVFLDGTVVSRDDYDLINNAAVFFTPPTSGQTLTLQVGTTPADILTSPTDAGIVAANITDINDVADALGDIATVLANIADINDVADDLNEAISEIETALANAQAAAASATAAAASATAAATSETNASTSETNAANSATASATSASASATSATASASSATDSATSATASASSATAAATSETNAATSATAASQSATSAATSASNALTSQNSAQTYASNALTSANNASTSETNAATSETNAATSASDAAASATAAQAALDSMEGTYLGGQASDPTVDLNGDPLNAGDWYFNTTSNISRIYDGSAWGDVAVSPSSFVSISGDTMTGELVAPSFQVTGGTGDAGTLSWNTDDETIDLVVSADVTYQLGQELGLVVKNESGSDISNGDVVKVTGASGNKVTIDLANASTESGSASTFAIATEDISNNSTGRVTTEGLVRGLNIDPLTYSDGDALWLDTTSGQFTNTKPTSPNHLVHLGWVTRAHSTEGTIFVHVNNGWEIDELHDVLITSNTDGEVLQWNATSSVWENQTLAEAGIAAVGHTHSISDITNLQTTLDGKEDAGNALAFAIALG